MKWDGQEVRRWGGFACDKGHSQPAEQVDCLVLTGQELMALSADALEGTASLLEVTASALVMSYGAQAYGAGACPAPIDMGQVLPATRATC